MTDVIVERVGALGRLRLDRPKALNALKPRTGAFLKIRA